MSHGKIAVLCLVFSLLAWGCSGPRVDLGLSSTANLNLNSFDEPLPVVTRVYQLADDQAFQKATFEQLWKNDLMTLGDALLTKDEIVMDPAAQQKLTYMRHEQARFVGVVAIFRQPEDVQWRDIAALPEGFFGRRFSRQVTVRLKGSSVEIAD